MNGKLYAIICALLTLPACFFGDSKQKEKKHTFFIQTPLDSESIRNIQEELKTTVENIIQEELGIKQDKGFPIFVFKGRQAITIYYVNDLYDNNEPLRGLLYLFVKPAMNSLQKTLAPQKTSISSNLEFFGEKKKGLFSFIDLVAHIDDPDKELESLNIEMKKAMHNTNKKYKRAYDIDLYDIAKSEKHSYLPHISLGHLRTNYIKYLVNDPAKSNEIIDRIKERIVKAVSNAIENLDPDERSLSLDSLALYDTKKKKYVHKQEL